MAHADPFPTFPTTEHATVFGWIGWQQGGLTHGLRSLGLQSFGRPLHYDDSAAHPSLFDVGDAGERILDPCTYLRQIPLEWRARSFRLAPYGNGPKLNPSLGALPIEARQSLAETVIDLQRERGASIVLPPYHLVGGVRSSGRRLDLDLAARSVDHFFNEAMDEPPSNSGVATRRHIFAAVGLPYDSLRSADIDQIAAAYGRLDVSGYWIRAAKFSDLGKTKWVEQTSALIGALKATGRPVVVAQPGRLQESLLACEVSCAIGILGYERFAPPNSKPSTGGGRRLAYHGASARTFVPTKSPAARAFRAAPCFCGAHPANEAPTGDSLVLHTSVVRLQEVRSALTGPFVHRRDQAIEHLTSARSLIAQYDLGVSASPNKALAVFRGLDYGLPERQTA